MKGCVQKIVLLFTLCFFILCFTGCLQDPGMVRPARNGYLPGGTDLMAEFPRKDLGEFYKKLSTAHKEELIRESLEEKYVSGVSYPYEYVYHHQYSLIRKDGSTIEYTDYAIRVNTAEALKTLGEQIFSYYASRETVGILRASVYSQDGRVTEADATSVREKEPYTGLVYSDLKVKSVSLKGVNEGSVLRILVKKGDRLRNRRNPIFKEIVLDNYVPAKERVYILRFEAGTEYAKRERVQGEVSDTVSAKKDIAANGDTLHIYTCIGGRTEIPEPGSIPIQEFDNRVFFFTPSTWDEVAKGYYSLSNPKAHVTEEIANKAKQLTKDLLAREEKIRAVYDYVRGIRYVAILLNQHEVIPHEAGLTFRNGYGDCKDKSVLLMAMLRALGIDSSIALVNTSHLVDKNIPSLSVFNHAIVALPEARGTYFFLDATTPHVPFGLLPLYIQHRHALVVGEKGGELVIVPPQSPDQNRVEETIDVEFHDVESATIRTRALTKSSNEIYHALPDLPRNVLRQMLQQFLSIRYKELDILDLKCDRADRQGFLLTETKLKIRDFAKRMGNAYAFNPMVDADTLRDHYVIAVPERRTVVELEGPKRLIVDITIRLPDPVTVEFLPKAKTVRNEKFGEYSYEISHKDNRIQIHRDLRIDAKRISVKDYEEFRTFYRECIRQEEEMVLLKKK